MQILRIQIRIPNNGSNPRILRHSDIWEVADDEAVLTKCTLYRKMVLAAELLKKKKHRYGSTGY